MKPTPIVIDAKITWESTAIPLADCKARNKALTEPGVYYLFSGARQEVTSPFDERVFYIGKSNRSIAGRAIKHYESVTAAARPSGKAASKPGSRLSKFSREVLNNDCSDVYLRRGSINAWFIGAAEDLLLRDYVKKHCRLPHGNTFFFGDLSVPEGPEVEEPATESNPEQARAIRLAAMLDAIAPPGFKVIARDDQRVVVKRDGSVWVEATPQIKGVPVRARFRSGEGLSSRGTFEWTDVPERALELLLEVEEPKDTK